jgi:DNA-binding NtrC family response regulator
MINREVAGDLMCAAHSHVPVLLTASCQLDREVCARLIHKHSSPSRDGFVVIRCRDAFGGNGNNGHGYHRPSSVDETHRSPDPFDLDRAVEQARGGTVFLDEIQQLSMDQQQFLYSALEGEPREGDASSPAWRNVRIICGASRSLSHQVADGRFMESLYYRLNMIHVDVRPPQS